MKSAYLKAAALDAASSASGAVATLNDSQIGKWLMLFRCFSQQKQESEQILIL
jgi:putative metalloprotease